MCGKRGGRKLGGGCVFRPQQTEKKTTKKKKKKKLCASVFSLSLSLSPHFFFAKCVSKRREGGWGSWGAFFWAQKRGFSTGGNKSSDGWMRALSLLSVGARGRGEGGGGAGRSGDEGTSLSLPPNGQGGRHELLPCSEGRKGAKREREGVCVCVCECRKGERGRQDMARREQNAGAQRKARSVFVDCLPQASRGGYSLFFCLCALFLFFVALTIL